MTNVYVEARPKGRREGDPIDDYVVSLLALGISTTRKNLITGALPSPLECGARRLCRRPLSGQRMTELFFPRPPPGILVSFGRSEELLCRRPFPRMGDRDAALCVDISPCQHSAEGAIPPTVAFRPPTF